MVSHHRGNAIVSKVIGVRCIDSRQARNCLKEGHHYYVVKSCEGTAKDETKIWYRVINETAMRDIADLELGSHYAHVRVSDRFEPAPSELCDKYNSIYTLQDIERALRKYGYRL